MRASSPIGLVAEEAATGSSRVAAAGDRQRRSYRLAGRMCMATANACGPAVAQAPHEVTEEMASVGDRRLWPWPPRRGWNAASADALFGGQ